MGSSSTHEYARDAVVEHARGVLAERFGIDIATADRILGDVARAQMRTVVELAGAVVESCTNGSTPLPRRLYTNSEDISDAA
jgi:ANTAR domain-containing protein